MRDICETRASKYDRCLDLKRNVFWDDAKLRCKPSCLFQPTAFQFTAQIDTKASPHTHPDHLCRNYKRIVALSGVVSLVVWILGVVCKLLLT